jgi:hypothetical protein
MRIFVPLALLSALVTTSAVWAGCGHSSDDGDSGDQAFSSGTAFSACTVISQKDGHTMTADELGKLGDPIANFVLKGQDCPLTLTKIAAKLTKTDPCILQPTDGGFNNNADIGQNSRFVTDRSQLLEQPDTYRAVIARACQKREDNELLISVFGIGTQTDGAGKVTAVSVPDNTIELIGEHKTTDANGTVTGVFNYYAREDNQWKFFGSSTDFLSQGYDCNDDGACVPKAATKQRCASCHVGGGLNMKELESPWVNWEGGGNSFGKHALDPNGASFGTPGVADIIAKRKDLFGDQSDGVQMEATVEEGNRQWIPARIAFLKTKGLKEVLRPLFCTTDMNLVEAGLTQLPPNKGDDPNKTQNQLSQDLFVDRTFKAFLNEGGSITFGEYMDAIKANGQHIQDGRNDSDQPLFGADGKPIFDTVQGLIIPARSGQDNAYIQELQNERVVDIDLVKDILSVDFTRPIYSKTRCDMLNALDFSPELAPDAMKFDAVKKKVADAATKVAGQSPALQKLAASTADPTDAGKHDFDAASFLKACDARAKSPTDRANYIKDYLAYASHLRRAVKRARNPVNGGIIEFPETLPVDDLQETRAAFDPKTCKLQ